MEARHHLAQAVRLSRGRKVRAIVALATVCQRLTATKEGRTEETRDLHQLALTSLETLANAGGGGGGRASAGAGGGHLTALHWTLEGVRSGAREAGLLESGEGEKKG